MQEKVVDDGVYFFGEVYRDCFGFCHIINACHLTLITDLFKMIFTCALLGDLDTVTVIYVAVAAISFTLALSGLLREKNLYFWPYIVLKMFESVFCLIIALLIFVIMMSGYNGRKVLADVVRMRYKRLDDVEAVGVALLFFFFFAILSAANAYYFRISYRCMMYIKRKLMAQYLQVRQQVFNSYLRH